MATERGVSEFVSEKLSEISNQLGQMATGFEGLREDLKDESALTKAHREHITQRVDNIAIRMGEAERAIAETKQLMDKTIMPLVTANNERKLMVSGALKFWGIIFVVISGMSAVMWTRLLNAALWLSGNGPSE